MSGKGTVVATLLLVAVAVLPAKAAAQGEEDAGPGGGFACDTFVQSCSGQDGSHWTESGSTSGLQHPGDTEDCYLSLANGEVVDAETCHMCSEHLAHNAGAYKRALAAGARGDVSTLLQFARQLDGFIVFNEARDAVQVVSCSKTAIVASLPINSAAQRKLAMALPRSSSVTERRVAALAALR